MTKEREEALCALACCFMSEACKTFETDDANQLHFLSVDSRTNETVVIVIAQGDAADLLLEYLDSHKSHESPRSRGEINL
jgi:hypothetical protein